MNVQASREKESDDLTLIVDHRVGPSVHRRFGYRLLLVPWIQYEHWAFRSHRATLQPRKDTFGRSEWTDTPAPPPAERISQWRGNILVSLTNGSPGKP